VLSYLATGFISDWNRISPQAAVLRVLRSLRVLRTREGARRLLDNVAYRRHVEAVEPGDPAFFLSHRHYLAKGLSPAQRARAAFHHYDHEVTAFDSAYIGAVYEGRGLVLWRREVDEGVFEIRLLPGNDVLFEGGVSVVAFFNDVRIAVLSYANVPTDILLPGYVAAEGEPPLEASTIFATRKQLTWDHALYQKAFNKAFDRSTVGHFCFAALTGLALAQGRHRLMAIAPEAHPAFTPELGGVFRLAYADFWASLGGRPVSSVGWLIDLPMRLTPLDQLDAKARKRAMARRQHIDDVQNETFETVRRHLVAPPALVNGSASLGEA
jgi:uncharacterized protein